MTIIKKIGIALCGIIGIFMLNVSFCLPNWGPVGTTLTGRSDPIINEEDIREIEQGSKTFTDRLQGILHLPQKNEYQTSLGYVLSLTQIVVNWLLGILSFVALVYMLYCGFLVFSSGSDDKSASKGKKGISTAAIALAGIGLSWLIISVMIWFISNISASK